MVTHSKSCNGVGDMLWLAIRSAAVAIVQAIRCCNDAGDMLVVEVALHLVAMVPAI